MKAIAEKYQDNTGLGKRQWFVWRDLKDWSDKIYLHRNGKWKRRMNVKGGPLQYMTKKEAKIAAAVYNEAIKVCTP